MAWDALPPSWAIAAAAICWCDSGCGDDVASEKVKAGCNVTY